MSTVATAPARRLGIRLAMSAAVLAAAAGAVSVGTYANWTTSVDATTGTVATGTVEVTLDGSDTLTSDVLDIAPGDSMQRLATFRNTGTIELSQVTLGATGTLDFALLAPWLHLEIAACGVAWTATGANTFACPQPQTTALVSTSLDGLSATPAVLAGLQTAGGASTPLRMTLTLAPNAPKTVQGTSTSVTYTLTGVPRAGRSL